MTSNVYNCHFSTHVVYKGILICCMHCKRQVIAFHVYKMCVQDFHLLYWCLQISADLPAMQLCLSEGWRWECVCRQAAAVYKHYIRQRRLRYLTHKARKTLTMK